MKYLLLFDALFLLLFLLPAQNAAVDALKFAAFALSAVLLRAKLPQLTARQKRIQMVFLLVLLCAGGLSLALRLQWR